jgi:DNA-binding PadR family transcriptional regulator
MSLRMTHITALVLRAIHAGYRYGFDIMDATGLPSGTVYPVLRRLERSGWLRSRWESATAALDEGRPRRRLYELTGAGVSGLTEANAKLAEARRLLSAPLLPVRGKA